MNQLKKINFIILINNLLNILILYFGLYHAYWINNHMLLPPINFAYYSYIIFASLIVLNLLEVYPLSNYNCISFMIFITFFAIGIITGVTYLVFTIYKIKYLHTLTIITAGMIQITVLSALHLIYRFITLFFLQNKQVLLIKENYDDNINLKLLEEKLQKQKGWIINKCFHYCNDENLTQSIKEADIVVLNSNLSYKDKIYELCITHQKELFIIPHTFDLVVFNAKVIPIDDILVFNIALPGLNRFQILLKRTMDITFSITMLLFFSPIMLLLYYLIPFTSKGPSIYKQKRLGLHKNEFYIYKFRSMIHEAEKVTGPTMALINDRRITRLGKFIRATRVDELPQLFNVLKGDMSLIGPRPERPPFASKYETTNPDYKYRSMVKPGITGLAQVMAKYSSPVADKLRFDLMYVQNYSLLLDFKILCYTIFTVFNLEQSNGISTFLKDGDSKI